MNTDLINADCPPIPENVDLPVVFMDGEVISSGVNIGAIDSMKD